MQYQTPNNMRVNDCNSQPHRNTANQHRRRRCSTTATTSHWMIQLWMIGLVLLGCGWFVRPAVSTLSSADEIRIQSMLHYQQMTLYEAGRHDGGPYESDIQVILKNPFNDGRDLLSIGGFVDSDTCWNHLNASDTDGSLDLDATEFVAFCQLLVPDVLPESITTYEQLPLVYQQVFIATSCLCQIDTGTAPSGNDDVDNDDCCLGDAARIRIPVRPSLNPNDAERNYLYTACSLTEEAAERFIGSEPPTPAPVATTTESPTTAPTEFPATEDPDSTTDAPSGVSSSPPTVVTTKAPLAESPAPSVTTTTSPTLVPSSIVTSVAPTVEATNVTTNAPTAVSVGETGFPSVPTAATSAPSAATVVAPTSAPSAATTVVSSAPSAATIVTPTLVESSVSYAVALRNGVVSMNDDNFIVEYLANLIVGLDNLAVSVLASGRRRQRRNLRWMNQQRRVSAVEVELPSSSPEANNIACPFVPDTPLDNSTLCQRIDATIRLLIPPENNSDITEFNFRSNLQQAIGNGDLQVSFDDLEWDTVDGNPIIVLTGLNIVPAPTPVPVRSVGSPNEGTLSPGQIFGISVGSILLVLVPISLILWQRRRRDDLDEDDGGDKPAYREYEAEDAPEDRATIENQDVKSKDLDTGTATLGAAQAYYGNKGGNTNDEAGMLLDEEDDDDDDDGAASSNAGSSGWSSSAGISSLNTGSVDDAGDIAAAAGATLAGLGVASAFSRNLRDSAGVSPSDTDDGHSEVPSASRDQLDSLIESGDWAAVGATAALLAAASDSQSGTSLSHASGSHAQSRDSQSMEAARAAELDHLVDAGDWEGVVAAAAKFEAQAGSGTASRSSKTNSSVESSGGSGSNTGTNTAGSPSVATSLSDTQSKAQKRAEVRSEVEALVRRVVPEEIDNVDEMMNQFKGREDELVETLRTMQERAVAQKARTAGHRAAKTEARRAVQRGNSGSSAPGTVVQKVASLEIKEAASGSGGLAAAGVGMTLSPKSPIRDQAKRSPEKAEEVVANARSALEEAIESGDWEAVGEAAAMISDNSITTASSAEIARIAGTSLSVSTLGSNRSRNNLPGVNADRASELDALIDRGDWSGVVAVANRFSESDRNESEGGIPSQEEEDALKEAELWMKIAEQKKAEGAMDAGASDAAEWAIQRSLSQLKDAEKKSGNADDEEEV